MLKNFILQIKKKIETKMATKVTQVIITSVLEDYCFTLACFPTNQATVESVNFLFFLIQKELMLKTIFIICLKGCWYVYMFLECDKKCYEKGMDAIYFCWWIYKHENRRWYEFNEPIVTESEV